MKGCKKITLSVLLLFKISLICAQTFSSADKFPDKSSSKKIKTETHIINLTTEKIDEQFVISGEILDKVTREGIPGITIIESGSTNGTTTDFDGKFKLKTSIETPVLNIQFTGFNSESVQAPNIGDSNNSVTSLSGLLVGNFGDESVIQPNIMLSQGWKLGIHAIELRVLGLQKNKDTVQKVNGLNLIKPEISKINFRLTGDIKPFKEFESFSIIPEINLFKQQLNQNISGTQNTKNNDITSLLGKISAGLRAAEGLDFYASGLYYNVFEGVQYYEDRFGLDAVKEFWNFELSGKFAFNQGLLDGTFLQAVFNINSTNYKELLNTKDSGIFLIRIGFDKALAKN